MRAFSVLEPCAGKLASTVLRGGNHRKMIALLDRYLRKWQRLFAKFATFIVPSPAAGP
jgi:hypothetical protein